MSLNCGIINRKHPNSHENCMNFIGPNIPFISHKQIANIDNLYDLISFEEMYHHFVSIKLLEINFADDIEYNTLLDIIELRDAISNKILHLNIKLIKRKHLEKTVKQGCTFLQNKKQNTLNLPINTSFSSMRSITPHNVYLLFDRFD